MVANNLLLTMVDEYCKGDPTKIGEAIQALYKDFVHLIPGWKDFLKAAQVYNSPEYLTLIELKEDTALYLQTYYATKE